MLIKSWLFDATYLVDRSNYCKSHGLPTTESDARAAYTIALFAKRDKLRQQLAH